MPCFCTEKWTLTHVNQVYVHNDMSPNLQNFIKDLHRSHKQAEMTSKLLGQMIQYHQHFCGETAKSFARLHQKLREIYPAGYEDLVSFEYNFMLACARASY